MAEPKQPRPPNPLRKTEFSIDTGTVRDAIKTGRKVIGKFRNKNRTQSTR